MLEQADSIILGCIWTKKEQMPWYAGVLIPVMLKYENVYHNINSHENLRTQTNNSKFKFSVP